MVPETTVRLTTHSRIRTPATTRPEHFPKRALLVSALTTSQTKTSSSRAACTAPDNHVRHPTGQIAAPISQHSRRRSAPVVMLTQRRRSKRLPVTGTVVQDLEPC